MVWPTLGSRTAKEQNRNRLTWVVPEKWPLNGCVCVCVCVCKHIAKFHYTDTDTDPTEFRRKKVRVRVRVGSV